MKMQRNVISNIFNIYHFLHKKPLILASTVVISEAETKCSIASNDKKTTEKKNSIEISNTVAIILLSVRFISGAGIEIKKYYNLK